MKKQISWWVLLILAGVSYVMRAVIGGIIGDVFGFFGFIMLLMGIIDVIRVIARGKKR